MAETPLLMLQLIAQFLGIVTLCGAVVVAAPLAQRLTTSQSMPQCEPGKWPEFNYGFAALRLDLGVGMGEAVECEHATTAAGDTNQQTSTGIARYDRASNTPSFRQGTDNWALTLKGLVFWSGTEDTAPAGTVAMPSPGSARLAAAAAQNSAPAGRGILATAPETGAKTASASPATAWLSTTQVAGVASLLGIKNEQVRSMTPAEVSAYTEQSGSSVADVTRTINTAAP